MVEIIEADDQVIVSRTTNGFIVTSFSCLRETEDGKKVIEPESQVIEGEEWDEPEAIVRMLYAVMERASLHVNNKHDKERLVIKWVKRGVEWTDMVVKWIRDADASGLEKGIVNPWDGLKRNMYARLDGVICPGCGELDDIRNNDGVLECSDCEEKRE